MDDRNSQFKMAQDALLDIMGLSDIHYVGKNFEIFSFDSLGGKNLECLATKSADFR
jgi:hypothetical protein